jgi:hypothetical protein
MQCAQERNLVLKEAIENIQDFICGVCNLDFGPDDDLNQNFFLTSEEPMQFKHITCMQ